MNKRFLKTILITSICIISLLLLSTISNAATLSISTSKTTVAPGETFTVTVSLNGGAGKISASTSNGTGSLGNTWLDNSSATFSCTAGSSGTVTISASGLAADYTTGEDENLSRSASVTIKQPETTTPSSGNNNSNTGGNNGNSNTSSNNNSSSGGTTSRPSTNTTTDTRSSNSNLSVLQIAEGSITPEFSSGTLEYQINVPNEITKLTITATPEDSNAIVKIAGNEELVVGENAIEVVVTAENGSTTVYKIKAIKAEAELNLQALNIFYINENGEKTPLTLNPMFESTIYEYTIENISHQIEILIVEGVATRENAEITVTGNEELKEGENIIQIKVVVKDESGLEEEKTYTIKVNKESAPVETPLSVWDRIKNWFVMAGTWVNTNIDKIEMVALQIVTVVFIGLTIYFAYDYKRYQKLLEQLATINKTNLMEKANVALGTENIQEEMEEVVETNSNEETAKIKEEMIQEENIEQNTISETEEKSKTKSSRGRRFRK